MACLALSALPSLPHAPPAAAPSVQCAGQLDGVPSPPRMLPAAARCTPHAGQPEAVRCAAQVLVEKARVEAEEAQRILLAALNGLAGLMILDSDRAQAVALYRKVRAGIECAGH